MLFGQSSKRQSTKSRSTIALGSPCDRDRRMSRLVGQLIIIIQIVTIYLRWDTTLTTNLERKHR